MLRQLLLNCSQPTGSSQAKGKNVTKELTGNPEDCILVASAVRDLVVFSAGGGIKPVSYAPPLADKAPSPVQNSAVVSFNPF